MQQPKLWLTYAWKDNEDDDVDYVIQTLRSEGIEVKYDRVQLLAGRRLWAAIDRGISDPQSTDGWAIYLTKNSLQSEPCQEELSYALDRALRTKGGDFPIIGIFPAPVDRTLIPSSIATRLYVDLRQPDWSSKIYYGLKREIFSSQKDVAPFVIKYHHNKNELIIEIRSRAGRWYPAYFAVPESELPLVRLASYGPAGSPPISAMVARRDVVLDNGFRAVELSHSVDSQNSMYIYVNSEPSTFAFGGLPELFVKQNVQS